MKRVSHALAMLLLYIAIAVWVVGLIVVAAPLVIAIYAVVGIVIAPLIRLYFQAVEP